MARLLFSQAKLVVHSRIAGALCCRRVSSSFFENDNTPPKLEHVTSDWRDLYKQSIRDPSTFWGQLGATRLHWMKNFDTVMDCDLREGKHRWFLGGKLNVSGKSGIRTGGDIATNRIRGVKLQYIFYPRCCRAWDDVSSWLCPCTSCFRVQDLPRVGLTVHGYRNNTNLQHFTHDSDCGSWRYIKFPSTENCVDIWKKKDPNRVALIWEKDEPGDVEHITYALVSLLYLSSITQQLQPVINNW